MDGCLRPVVEQMAVAEEQYEAVKEEVVGDKPRDGALKAFREERERFSEGRRLIEQVDEYPRVREAFKALNLTFANTADFGPDGDSWLR